MKGQIKSKTKKKMQISINKYLNVWIFKKHKNEKTYKKPIKSIVHLYYDNSKTKKRRDLKNENIRY